MPVNLRGPRGPVDRCHLCGELRKWVLRARRVVLICAACFLFVATETDPPIRLLIDSSLAYQNNLASSSVASSSSFDSAAALMKIPPRRGGSTG